MDDFTESNLKKKVIHNLIIRVHHSTKNLSDRPNWNRTIRCYVSTQKKVVTRISFPTAENSEIFSQLLRVDIF